MGLRLKKKYISFVGKGTFPSEVTRFATDFKKKWRDPVNILQEFAPFMEKLCRLPQLMDMRLSLDEMTKILRTLNLIQTLDDSINWLNRAL